MLAAERRNRILEKLQKEKKVVVGQLSQEFGVSEETIRRDLERLERDGLAVKSYGGAVLNESLNIEVPFNVRKKRNVEGKQKIARMVADLIGDGEHLMMDASSTSVFIAKALKKKRKLTVVTNSIEVMLEASDVEGWKVISTGGRMKEGYLALVGAKAVEGILAYHAEKAILSCKAFDISRGFSDSSEEIAQVKQTMLRCSKECILAVDSSKFRRLAFAKIGDFKDVDKIVTDEKPDERMLRIFWEAGVECVYPQV